MFMIIEQYFKFFLFKFFNYNLFLKMNSFLFNTKKIKKIKHSCLKKFLNKIHITNFNFFKQKKLEL